MLALLRRAAAEVVNRAAANRPAALRAAPSGGGGPLGRGPLLGRRAEPLAASGAAGGGRNASTNLRRRRRAFHRAQADPHVNPAKINKLRERCAQPSHDLLRYLAENKVGRVASQADRKALWYDLRYKKYAPVFLSQMKPRMRLWAAALEEAQLPPARLAEVAVCGRSNSGKSTLVNYLCGRHCAHVKRTPGSTTEIVFWQIGRPAQLCLVDLPGYGFAEAPDAKRLQWTEFTLWYVRARRNLARVLLLVDSRQGLKPTDKEMIAYLERHSVAWQIVVTKCDKVKAKDLAKRLTILGEELTGYRKMAGQPIPVSAIKRKGMDALREVLDKLKVMKEVVKEGIKRRVYDLMELRRLKRREKQRRRREAKLEDGGGERPSESGAAPPEAPPEAAMPGEEAGEEAGDLHSVLDDWCGPAADGRGAGGGAAGAWASREPSPKPSVSEARYSLEDRDSLRVVGFMQSLFPDLPAAGAESTPAAPGPAVLSVAAEGTPGQHWNFAAGPGDATDFASAGELERGGGKHWTVRAWAAEDESWSDSDDEALDAGSGTVLSNVLRFDPPPPHAATRQHAAALSRSSALALSARPGAGEGSRSTGGVQGSLFPRLGAVPRGRAADEASPGGAGGAATVGLRSQPGRDPRPWAATAGSADDRIYTQDDLESPEDRAAGLRPFAPPAPTPETRGQLLTAARKRYEREWAMELEDVDEARATAVGVPATSANKAGAGVGGGGGKDGPGPRREKRLPGPKLPFITQAGGKTLPKGSKRTRAFGRRPATILKRKYLHDAARVLKVHNRKGRRRNVGSGLEWEEAQKKWTNWYDKNWEKRWDKIEAAESPKKEDVEAAYEERRQRRTWGTRVATGAGPRRLRNAGAGRRVARAGRVAEDLGSADE